MVMVCVCGGGSSNQRTAVQLISFHYVLLKAWHPASPQKMIRLYLAALLPTRATACIRSLECTVASPSARFNAMTRLVHIESIS